MRNLVIIACILGALTLVVVAGAKERAAASDQNSIVITFKDGHQQSIPLADVARIEFKTAPATAAAPANAAAPPAHPLSSARFVGRWEVGDGMGGTFFIRLEKDGTASKSIGATHGTWALINGEAEITWDDGWRDAIRKVGSKYEKAAFRPGHTFSDAPSNVTDAKNTEPSPI